MSGTIPFRASAAPSAPVPSWHAHCQTTKNGLIPNLHNVLIALREDPHWKGRFRYNAMLRSVVAPHHQLQDIDGFHAHAWMQANGLKRIGIDPVREAIEIIARETTFHPVRDWLGTLEWDGTPRLADWLITYVGADPNEYHRQAGTLFLAAMVARIYQPGCKADYTLVLEGPQRQLKSTLCATLAGDERYFSDHLPDLTADKEVAAHLSGKWVIEISELSAFQRTDNEKLKAFLTRQTERYRPAYGRSEVYEPRQCVFIGTTNKFVWMKDETGGRRFWPVRCGTIEIEALARDREQLLAEAIEFYRTRNRWWPETDIETTLFEPQQAERQEDDAWQDPISKWTPLNPPPHYLLDIAQGALFMNPERIGVAEQRRLVRVLEVLGWTRNTRTKRGIPWNPPP